MSINQLLWCVYLSTLLDFQVIRILKVVSYSWKHFHSIHFAFTPTSLPYHIWPTPFPTYPGQGLMIMQGKHSQGIPCVFSIESINRIKCDISDLLWMWWVCGGCWRVVSFVSFQIFPFFLFYSDPTSNYSSCPYVFSIHIQLKTYKTYFWTCKHSSKKERKSTNMKDTTKETT